MLQRLTRGGHEVVGFDVAEDAVASCVELGGTTAPSLEVLVSSLSAPRLVWVMLPAGDPTSETVRVLSGLLHANDVIVDGGNSHYREAALRSRELEAVGIHFLDVGTSGGVRGLTEGFSLMIGGPEETIENLKPIFATLAPAPDRGWGRVGPVGAGHFVKMVHNGIEYGIMAAYAEGLNILQHANVGRQGRKINAETAPLRNPEHYQYDLNLPDIAEVWRRGSVVASWLLDLTASALLKQPDAASFSGRVSDSGEGRWTMAAAIEEGVPVPVLSNALYERFSSRGEADFANKLLSAMRFEFGGHQEETTAAKKS